jgi:hypothetical protein
MTQALGSRWHTYPRDTADRSLRAVLPLWLTTPGQYGLSQNFRVPHAYQDARTDIVISHLFLHLVGTPWSKRNQGSILDAAPRTDQARRPQHTPDDRCRGTAPACGPDRPGGRKLFAHGSSPSPRVSTSRGHSRRHSGVVRGIVTVPARRGRRGRAGAADPRARWRRRSGCSRGRAPRPSLAWRWHRHPVSEGARPSRRHPTRSH